MSRILTAAFASILFAGLTCLAATGPIRESRTAEQIVDSFDSTPPLYRHRNRGKITPTLTPRTGYSRDGAQSLLITIPPTGEKGRNSLIMEWTLREPVDWTEWDGLSFWYQAQDEASPGFTADLTEADGAHYWRKAAPKPRMAGQWQLVELPFAHWSWSWEGPEDKNKHFDRNGLKRLKFEIRGHEAKSVVFALDGLGLYHAEPAYSGPTVSIGVDKGGWRRPPNSDYQLSVNVGDLQPGQTASIELKGVDYWGNAVLSRRIPATLPAGAQAPQPVAIPLPGQGSNYVDLVATLSMDDKPLFRAERAAAWIRPQAPEDAGPNPDSIFGIWVGGGQWSIGAKWSRMYLRGSDVKLVDGQYVVHNGEPGVYAPKPDKRLNWTFYFSKMPKWLTSRPERADWYKWSPNNWDDYGEFVEFAVRGAYAGGVRHFEVWNEPVPYAYWMGPMESVVKLHEVTYKAAKRVAPDAVVLGPCPYSFVWGFLETYFELGGGKWIDQVVIHAYGGNPDLEFVAKLRKLREMLAKYDLGDRDIYITEKGFSTPQFSEHQQAHNLVKTYVYCLSERIRLLTWHMLWDYSPKGGPGHAILRHDHTPRPSYCAYTAMTSVLERAEYVGPVPGLAKSQRGFEFAKRGTTIRVLWGTSATPTQTVIRTPAETATRIDLMGGETHLTSSAPGRFTPQLTLDPIYLITRE
ncbi:MAG: hypothetical protein HN742_35665 [Lentisphaerae bacterium]|jgi:hypothetical protein|nr:hypothetical protein [Lentisphaerota bacterium]MBT5608972.1 hypothetical protein [Lentisphaerota bacterium]MBT7057531.1 hypothetical protein [Lentisphaerota bacterium]MBT7847263.1 hypothetical protein [Lentisphaerota bacterium]